MMLKSLSLPLDKLLKNYLKDLYEISNKNSMATVLIFEAAGVFMKYTDFKLAHHVAAEHGTLPATSQLRLGYVFLRGSSVMVTLLQTPLAISARNSVVFNPLSQ